MDHRLSRRGLFAGFSASFAVTTLGGCSGTPAAQATTTPTSEPPADTPLATWEFIDGPIQPPMLALHPPRLVVFGDGEAIADATYRSLLDPDQLVGLASGLLSDLKTIDAQKKRTGAPDIADAPVTKVSVWTAAGVLRASAEGLDELRDQKAYANELYDARDRLAAVHKTVSATAQPYLADRVRIVAAATGQELADAKSWPTEITLPAPDADQVRKADLDGDAARAAVRTLTRDLDQRGAWPTYRTADGKLVQASWRYLLPNE